MDWAVHSQSSLQRAITSPNIPVPSMGESVATACLWLHFQPNEQPQIRPRPSAPDYIRKQGSDCPSDTHVPAESCRHAVRVGSATKLKNTKKKRRRLVADAKMHLVQKCVFATHQIHFCTKCIFATQCKQHFVIRYDRCQFICRSSTAGAGHNRAPNNSSRQQLLHGEPAELEVGVVRAAPDPSAGAGRHALTQQPLAAPNVRIVTYNILADQYASQEHSQKVLFSFCPSKCALAP